MKCQKKKQVGFSLFEVLVALNLIMILIWTGGRFYTIAGSEVQKSYDQTFVAVQLNNLREKWSVLSDINDRSAYIQQWKKDNKERLPNCVCSITHHDQIIQSKVSWGHGHQESLSMRWVVDQE